MLLRVNSIKLITHEIFFFRGTHEISLQLTQTQGVFLHFAFNLKKKIALNLI